ncbi:DUF58 domain-containing protein [Caldalkalibacillus salinus]|uniref:DUF58 domain-containing protein n=1 Tax=Caldalkalibacillus salinus TaxID=2803787 RepID=UPI0019230DEE|nr:DUF58 domain-containing protein [Caldalkalibacillus salinus]
MNVKKDPKLRVLRFMAIIFLMIAVLFNVGPLLYLSFFIFLLNLFSHMYLKNGLKHIEVDVKWQDKRLFPGEKSRVTMTINHKGKIGLSRLIWSFQLRKHLHLKGPMTREGEIFHTYEVPLSLSAHEGTEYTWEGEALKRGVIQVLEGKLTLADPFETGVVTKGFSPDKRHELLIYPQLQPIQGLKNIALSPMGDRAVQASIYEDPSYTVGARLYEPGDPFNKIDWKATARKPHLHTKLRDKTAHTECVIIGNVRAFQESWRGIDETLVERAISAIGSLAQYATTQNIPYQVLINIRSAGYKPFFHIERGTGRDHYIRTLEALARVGVYASMPYEECVYYAHQTTRGQGKIFVLVTPYITDDIKQLQHKMQRDGITVFIIDTAHENLTLGIWGKTLALGHRGRHYA